MGEQALQACLAAVAPTVVRFRLLLDQDPRRVVASYSLAVQQAMGQPQALCL